MSRGRKRYDTLRAVVIGSRLQNTRAIDRELLELADVHRVTPQRRRFLLQVLHSTRAFDTTLNRIVSQHVARPDASIGRMLRQLESLPTGHPGHLPAAKGAHYRTNVANVRNRYMHAADAFPTNAREVDTLISEIEACLTLLIP